MRACFERYVAGTPLESRNPLRVLDVGGADVNGSYADICKGFGAEYIAADISDGPGVSIVLDDPYHLPFEDGSIDIVLSGQMLEHNPRFWLVFAEMIRVLKTDGRCFLIAPSAGPIHRYPVDCYRFYPDAYEALAELSGCHLVDCWLDERGPWRDLVGIFSKVPVSRVARPVRPILRVPEPAHGMGRLDAPENAMAGARDTKDVLKSVHEHLRPRSYMEIGVRHGASLVLATCPAVGVDPDPDILCELPATTRLVRTGSDDFFADGTDPILKDPPDLILIDGLHLFEQALRDFMHAEKHAHPDTLVIIDDVLPNHPIQASRERQSIVWTGDIWKLTGILAQYRPDLTLRLLDTAPTGLLLVSGLDPASRVLWDAYNPIVRSVFSDGEIPGPSVLSRRDAAYPSDELIAEVGKDLRRSRSGSSPKDHAGPSVADPKLSVVVISYNMARELSRTLKSLSPAGQTGMLADDYEIIVVDNGSTEVLDIDALKVIAPNARFIRMEGAGASPIPAIRRGMAEAKADIISVMIDGARMASPGLLSSACRALDHWPKAVVGTLAFHIGPKVQMESVQEGYNQAVEDALLETANWEDDGYSLFDISVLAGSSAKGWHHVPAETNALFARRAVWDRLDGFDVRFEEPGGGLANLDTWKRACEEPGAEVVMLLGEATFHQFHGGIATNAPVSPWDRFHEEYRRIRGTDYEAPVAEALWFGQFRRDSARRADLTRLPDRQAR